MLNNAQKRYLKSLAHARKPYIIVGGNGLTPTVLNEIDAAVSHHELIKVRVCAENREQRAELITFICKTLDTELIQRIGHIAILFRRNLETPRVQLP